MIVEDDPDLQRTIVEHLQSNRFEVKTATSYDTALRELETCQPTIVCVDLGLPSESGYEVCEHIRKQDQLLSVPILVMSERNSPEDMAHAEEAGANAFLRKPFTMKQLTKYFDALLSNRNVSRPSVRRLRI
jgi:two-component system chemotaxis response regulator CheY